MRKKRICCVILALMLILCENFQMIYAKDNEAEKYDRGDWIQQHMDYSMSEQYTKEIVRGFRGSLYQAVSEIKNDKLIRGYSTLDAVNKVMDYDLDLSKKDEYQLLLAQILFSYEGAASIEEVYMQNMANAFIKIGELIEMYDAADNLIDNDQLNAILDMLRSAESVKKINEACEKFIDFTGDEKFDKLISDDWIDYFDECKYLTNVLVSYLKEIRNGSKKTFQEIALYVATGEAYAKTSDTFGDILLYMRKNIDIPSDEERFQPIATSNLVSDQMILNLIGADGVKFANVLDTPVVLKDMAEALEEFYDLIQNYRDQNSQKIIDIVVENFRESNKNFVFKIGSHTVDAFLNCLPIFSQYEQLKSLFSTGQAIIHLFTSIDDEQYLENMVLKLYCISYIEYLAVDSIASNKSGWTTGAIKIENGIASMENTGKMTEEELEDYQFQRASTFDEAVGVYKSISLVAIDYARKYYFTLRSSENMSFFRNRNKIKEYDEILQKLNDQKQEINKIHCHTVKVDKDEAMGDAGNISELIKNIRADKGESNEGETNKENANEGDIYEWY